VTDQAIGIIEGVADKTLSFQWFRSKFQADNGLKDSLDFGHTVIDTPAKLDQYLYSYGPMIESQWEHVAHYLADVAAPSSWIDYGCGQRLAGLLVSDLTQGVLFGSVRDICLIEPSAVALARSEALYQRLAPAAEVASVCKRFDDVHEIDLPDAGSEQTLHLFSNSLDVLGFDPIALLKKTVRAGRHTIISVSHDRTFNGGTPRIESVKAAFDDPAKAPKQTVRRSTLEKFTCDNPGQSKGVVWLCEVEVKDG
jgi:hypothetical protein